MPYSRRPSSGKSSRSRPAICSGLCLLFSLDCTSACSGGSAASGIGGTPPALVNQRQPVFSDTPIETAARFGASPERTANQNRRRQAQPAAHEPRKPRDRTRCGGAPVWSPEWSVRAKARALAGLKGYVTILEAPTAEYVIGAYHQLWQIENSFRMSIDLEIFLLLSDSQRGAGQ
jgi:hypothetical protein